MLTSDAEDSCLHPDTLRPVVLYTDDCEQHVAAAGTSVTGKGLHAPLLSEESSVGSLFTSAIRQLMFSRGSGAEMQIAKRASRAEEQQRMLLRACARRWMHAKLAAGWETWAGWARRKHFGKECVKSWGLGRQAEVWREWQQNMHLRRILRKVLKRWTHRLIAAAWTAWVEHEYESKRLRSLAKQVLGRWVGLHQIRAIEKWRSICRRRTYLNVLSRCENKVKARCGRLSLRSAFEDWLALMADAKEGQHRTHIAEQIVALGLEKQKLEQLLLDHGLSQALEEQMQHKIAEAEQEVQFMRAESAAAQEALQRKFDARAREQQAFKLASIVKKWQLSAAAAGFRCWYDHARHQRTMRRQARSVVARWFNQTLYAAWSRWLEKTWQVRVLRRAVISWRQLELKCVFAQWRDQVDHKLETRASVLRVMFRKGHSMLMHAFASWRRVHVSITRLRLAGAKVVRRWGRLECSKSFRTWSMAVSSYYLVPTAAYDRRAQVLCRLMLKLAPSLLSLSPPTVAANKRFALRCWQQHLVLGKRRRSKGLKITKRWLHLRLATAWDCWVASIGSGVPWRCESGDGQEAPTTPRIAAAQLQHCCQQVIQVCAAARALLQQYSAQGPGMPEQAAATAEPRVVHQPHQLLGRAPRPQLPPRSLPSALPHPFSPLSSPSSPLSPSSLATQSTPMPAPATAQPCVSQEQQHQHQHGGSVPPSQQSPSPAARPRAGRMRLQAQHQQQGELEQSLQANGVRQGRSSSAQRESKHQADGNEDIGGEGLHDDVLAPWQVSAEVPRKLSSMPHAPLLRSSVLYLPAVGVYIACIMVAPSR